jgi:hypothetical protein
MGAGRQRSDSRGHQRDRLYKQPQSPRFSVVLKASAEASNLVARYVQDTADGWVGVRSMVSLFIGRSAKEDMTLFVDSHLAHGSKVGMPVGVSR